MTTPQIMQLVFLLAVLFVVFPGFLYYTRNTSMAGILRNIAIWLGIALIIAFLYQTFG